MSVKPIPCFTIICDLCGRDASRDTEYVGMMDVRDVRDIADDCEWINVGDLDICFDHWTWAEDNVGGTCYSCEEDDGPVYAGNCSECWREAMKK